MSKPNIHPVDVAEFKKTDKGKLHGIKFIRDVAFCYSDVCTIVSPSDS